MGNDLISKRGQILRSWGFEFHVSFNNFLCSEIIHPLPLHMHLRAHKHTHTPPCGGSFSCLRPQSLCQLFFFLSHPQAPHKPNSENRTSQISGLSTPGSKSLDASSHDSFGERTVPLKGSLWPRVTRERVHSRWSKAPPTSTSPFCLPWNMEITLLPV